MTRLSEFAELCRNPAPDLAATLRRFIKQVPPGKVTTYGTLAARLGLPAAARCRRNAEVVLESSLKEREG